MNILEYARLRMPTAKLALVYSIVSCCIGLGGNVYGAVAAWSIRSVPTGTIIHPLNLQLLLFADALVTAAVGIAFGAAGLMKGRGHVGLILLACLGIHLCLIPYLVSNAVLDHWITHNGLVTDW